MENNVVENEIENNEVCENCMQDIDKITNVVVEENLSVNPRNKLTTRWATIKARK